MKNPKYSSKVIVTFLCSQIPLEILTKDIKFTPFPFFIRLL